MSNYSPVGKETATICPCCYTTYYTRLYDMPVKKMSAVVVVLSPLDGDTLAAFQQLTCTHDTFKFAHWA